MICIRMKNKLMQSRCSDKYIIMPRERDRQTDRQTNRQTDRERHTERETEKDDVHTVQCTVV